MFLRFLRSRLVRPRNRFCLRDSCGQHLQSGRANKSCKYGCCRYLMSMRERDARFPRTARNVQTLATMRVCATRKRPTTSGTPSGHSDTLTSARNLNTIARQSSDGCLCWWLRSFKLMAPITHSAQTALLLLFIVWRFGFLLSTAMHALCARNIPWRTENVSILHHEPAMRRYGSYAGTLEVLSNGTTFCKLKALRNCHQVVHIHVNIN